MINVIKRDGEIADFNLAKITNAIKKAFKATSNEYSQEILELLSLRVTADFQPKLKNGKISVEEIQDSVEHVLEQTGYTEVAKAYILYRKQREKIRNMKATILDYKDVVNSYVKVEDWRVKENSTVTYSVGGLILSNSGAVTANYWLSEVYDEEIAQAISVIFLFNVIAALIFPTLGGVLGLSNEGFGLFAGTAVNDTSSVTAAAAAWDGMHPGANTLDTAAIVKMTRTLAIIPITLVLALLRTRREGKQGGAQVDIKKIFPWFVLLFLLASIITTVLPIPAAAVSFLKNASKFFIVMAMAAIGLNTDIVKLVKTGGKPIFMGFCCWVAIAGVIAMEPSVLILDEPTAALDPIAENQLYLKYSELTDGKLSFFISHRLSSTRFCDRILFMSGGQITEMGTHEELMAKKGAYYKMFQVQSYYYREQGVAVHA